MLGLSGFELIILSLGAPELLRDFELFARRMGLQFIFHGQNKQPHPFHVKSNWMPPVVALESYLERVKTQLAVIKITNPKQKRQNLLRNEMVAFKRVKTETTLP